jgi:hypothetical protein
MVRVLYIDDGSNEPFSMVRVLYIDEPISLFICILLEWSTLVVCMVASLLVSIRARMYYVVVCIVRARSMHTTRLA